MEAKHVQATLRVPAPGYRCRLPLGVRRWNHETRKRQLRDGCRRCWSQTATHGLCISAGFKMYPGLASYALMLVANERDSSVHRRPD
jgi:hypothetical protein